jgi:hypothetical protein
MVQQFVHEPWMRMTNSSAATMRSEGGEHPERAGYVVGFDRDSVRNDRCTQAARPPTMMT